MEIIELFSPLYGAVSTTYINQDSKSFILAEEFISEHNGSSGISMANNFSNLNGRRLMSQLLSFVLFLIVRVRLYR